MIFWIAATIIFLVLFVLLLRYRELYLKEKFNKSSMSVKYGKFIENYVPWIKKVFPNDPKKFRFIGNPIDGILFDDDEIIFMEFKTGSSKLSEKQKKIKQLVNDKRVKWREIRIK